jgi:hypothetical protein
VSRRRPPDARRPQGRGATKGGKTGNSIPAVEVGGHETVEPTPDILDALERDYPLEASVADLVDNSIDAQARHVLVRFMRTDTRLVSLCIADDGRGISEKDARRAMTFAGKRTYGKSDLGMFGVGLKTASLSQADTLIVVSRGYHHDSMGRQWTKSGIKDHAWRLDVIKERSVAAILDHPWGDIGAIKSGTVVRWDHVKDFERLHVGVDAYIEQAKLRIKNHLGLKLHRFLKRGQIEIQIDVEDVGSGQVGPPSKVVPMDPFPPTGSSGARGYPKVFVAHFPSVGNVSMRANIWRKKSRDEGYKLGGGRVAEHQGFYFFRHDRLIQDGGWCGILGTNEPHMSLARVEIDIPDTVNAYLKVRSNKTGVDVPATFGPAVLDAKATDGSSFSEFLQLAESVYRLRGAQTPRPMLTPGSGIPAEVRRALEKASVKFVRGQRCTIAWRKLTGSNLLQIDQNERQILLNRRYRKKLLHGAHGGTTDVPLLRTLLYFVFEGLLAGDRIGPVERARLDAIQAAMNAALKLEDE